MWSWNGLKNGFRWLAKNPIVVVILIGVSVIAVLIDRDGSELAWNLYRGEPGLIVVNTPTIYTRQRLVNDRLKQARWLEERLDESDKDFRQFAQKHVTSENSNITVGGEREETTKEPESSIIIADKLTRLNNVNIETTTSVLFRSINSYTEELRNEITQTQLDDRHDIQGNTIYKLTFDASILSGSRKDKSALIGITLSHSPIQNNTNSNLTENGILHTLLPDYSRQKDKLYDKDGILSKIYSDDYELLYYDWVRYMQSTLDKSLIQSTSAITEVGVPEERMRRLFSRFLYARLCEFLWGDIDLDTSLRFSCDQSGINSDRKKTIDDLMDIYTTEYIVFKREQNSLNHEENMKLYDSLFSSLEAKSNPKWPKVEQVKFAKAIPFPRLEQKCRELGSKIIGLAQVAPEIGIALENDVERFPPLGCPAVEWQSAKTIAAVLLYEELFRFNESNRDESLVNKSPGFIIAKLLYERNRRCVGISQTSRDSCGRVELRDAAQCFASDFIRSYLSRFDGMWWNDELNIQGFMNVTIAGRRLGDCGLSVTPSNDVSKVVQKLKRILNASTEAYAYSVVPKNALESVLTLSESGGSFGASFQQKLFGDEDVSIEAARETSTVLEAAVPHPVVVGFGSGRQPAQAAEGRQGVGGLRRSSTTINRMSFGWIVAPRVRGVGRFEQIDVQFPLAAYISVPSWWRSVLLDVETCWLTKAELTDRRLKGHEEFDLCEDNLEVRDWTIIRLPGAIAELSRKLGFEVVQEPYLEKTRTKQVLEIGQPGNLLLRGGRLWRSTEVTMGAQRADSITVLPNMEGIVAYFRCVLPQSGDEQLRTATTSTGEGERVKVTLVPVDVWTSEGAATGEVAELKWPRPQRKFGEQAKNPPCAGVYQN